MKNKKTEFIQRIPSHYVGDDCLQIMLPNIPNSNVTILTANEIKYHFKQQSSIFINTYIQDERRKQFPYHQIPIHQNRVGFKKIEYINQLLDFGKVHLSISDCIREDFALKDGEEALLATKILLPHLTTTKTMFVSQLVECLKNKNALYIYEGQILSLEILIEGILQGATTNKMWEMKELLISIQIENGEISKVQAIDLEYQEQYYYKVFIYDFPVTIYNLEYMQRLEQTNFRSTPEPKVKKIYNKQINKETIHQEKRKVLTLLKNK